MEIVGNVWNGGKFDLLLENGEVVLTVTGDVGPVALDMKVKLEGDKLALIGLDWLKLKIPGEISDAVITAVEDAIKKLMVPDPAPVPPVTPAA